MQNKNHAQQLLMTPLEAAKALALSQRSLWRLTHEGSNGIPFLKIGRLVRYPVEDVKAWIEANKQRTGNVEPAQEPPRN